MSNPADSERKKARALREGGSLNSSPENVNDPKFKIGEFFDPRDIVQVKYEMLRRVLVEHATVTDAVEEYGFSRPTFYEAKARFTEAGISGLAPRTRGPRKPHKLHGDVLEYLERQLVPGQPIRARQLAEQVRLEYGLDLHPRTIERALRKGKKRREP